MKKETLSLKKDLNLVILKGVEDDKWIIYFFWKAVTFTETTSNEIAEIDIIIIKIWQEKVSYCLKKFKFKPWWMMFEERIQRKFTIPFWI